MDLAKVIVDDLYRAKPKHTNKVLQLNVPIPPSINHMYINTRGGGKHLTALAEKYIRTSRALINLAIQEQHWDKPNKHIWLYLDMVFYMPDRRVRDSHNCLKLLLDVMQDLVYENDYYVMPRIQTVEYDMKHPRVIVNVRMQSDEERQQLLS